MRTINIIDNGCERYTIKPDCFCLGRRWDNIAEQVTVVKPEAEKNNVCAMIVLHDNEVIDHIIVGDEPIDITSNLSQYASVEIGFSFSNVTGYIKNSEIKLFYFADAIKPSDFVPMPPAQWTNIDLIMGSSITRTEVIDNVLYFYNLGGQVMSSVNLDDFVEFKQDKRDDKLTTIDKTIVGAINEINAKIGNTASELQNILGV